MNGSPSRLAASAALLLLLLMGSAGAVLADCIQPPPIEQAVREADVVFVGTVTGLSNGGRWATVAVEEVWVGPDLPPVVEVRGGPAGNSATSVDRSFRGGTRYLFVPLIADGTLQDNSCTSTTEFVDDHARLRPATPRQPVSAEPEPEAPFDVGLLLPPAALVIAAALVVFGAAFVLRRER
jgi:hypothetical protein